MTRFHEPDLGANPDDPFARDTGGKLVRRGFWLADLVRRADVRPCAIEGAAEVVDDHLRAVFCEHEGVFPTDAAAGPGDDHDTIRTEITLHEILQSGS